MSPGFLTRSDRKRPVQSQKKVRILKFWIEVEEELYYTSSENKGTDQLCSYCTADLRLCFHIDKIRFSYDVAHNWFIGFSLVAISGYFFYIFFFSAMTRDALLNYGWFIVY